MQERTLFLVQLHPDTFVKTQGWQEGMIFAVQLLPIYIFFLFKQIKEAHYTQAQGWQELIMFLSVQLLTK